MYRICRLWLFFVLALSACSATPISLPVASDSGVGGYGDAATVGRDAGNGRGDVYGQPPGADASGQYGDFGAIDAVASASDGLGEGLGDGDLPIQGEGGGGDGGADAAGNAADAGAGDLREEGDLAKTDALDAEPQGD